MANSSSGSSLHQDFESGRHVCRPGTAPAIIRSGRVCSDEVNNFLLAIAFKPFFFSFTLDMGKNKVDFVTGLCEFYLCLLL